MRLWLDMIQGELIRFAEALCPQQVPCESCVMLAIGAKEALTDCFQESTTDAWEMWKHRAGPKFRKAHSADLVSTEHLW